MPEISPTFEIGQRYKVPCVKLLKTYHSMRVGSYVPVIGPLHSDAEFIKFPDEHWHVDWRFVSARQRAVIWRNPLGIVVTPTYSIGPVVLRSRKCHGLMPEFPGGWQDPQRVPWLDDLQGAFKDHVLKDDLICPHRGVPLKGCPVKDGVVVCPGHGLAWNVATGQLHNRLG